MQSVTGLEGQARASAQPGSNQRRPRAQPRARTPSALSNLRFAALSKRWPHNTASNSRLAQTNRLVDRSLRIARCHSWATVCASNSGANESK